jgi:DNA-binding NarL/FixJ family response regulator
VEHDRTLDAVVAAALDYRDASASSRHRVAASLPGLASGRRIELATSDRGTVVVVAPSGDDDWAAILTAREREVASAVARGRTNREIAAELYVSVATVKDHVHHILTKTGLSNRAAIAGRWRASGWA